MIDLICCGKRLHTNVWSFSLCRSIIVPYSKRGKEYTAMKLYSPFLDANNEFLGINDVTYANLEQLKVLDEGYQLEFKSDYNENVKKKLPSIIASFANSSGGWIIIGVEDKNKEIIPIKRERNDFGQLISQLIKGHVTPIPQYDVRFLTSPDDSNSGVLIICVYEGNFAPYISNGTIFIRNGSSKEPIQRADRATIELLFGKGDKYKSKIDAFCRREIFFPYNNILHKTRDYSICNVYIKSLASINKIRTYQEKENIKNLVITEKESIFHAAQFDLHSILFRHKPTTPFGNEITVLYELYDDFSAKIHVPLANCDDYEKEYATQKINAQFCRHIEEKARYKILDGVVAIDSIWASIKKHIDILKNNNISISDLVIQMECEDIENTVLFFDCPLYYEYIKKNGLCYSQKQSQKTDIIYLKDCEDIEYEQLDQAIAFDLFTYLFGFHPDRAFEIYKESHKIKYPDIYG